MAVENKIGSCMGAVRRLSIMAVATVALCLPAFAVEHELGYEATLSAGFGSGDFAPSYMSANNNGVITQPNTTTLRLSTGGALWNDHNFTFCYGADVIGGYASKTNYGLYDAEAEAIVPREAKTAPLWLHQLYAEASYRSLFATVGMKEGYSVLLNQDLSSGDLCFSGNTRPMPGVTLGFVDFQNIPLTNGWVQINGALGYYKTLDKKWKENRFNYYNSFISTDYVLNYKYLHLRTNPAKPFSLTIGMQAACQVGGTTTHYVKGEVTKVVKNKLGFKDLLRAMIPGSGGEDVGDQVYYSGNHVGTWDVMGRYRFQSGAELMLYYQSPWEDGSGIGKLNGFDGLYGIEYMSSGEGVIDGAVVEYLDLMNQSGPIHWAPGDHPGTPIGSQATGSDDYYNNYDYDGYQYFGQALGSPMIRTSLYNTDGYMRITDNRIRAFHLAVKGHIGDNFDFRMKFGYRKSWGTSFIPLTATRSATSFMLEGKYRFSGIDGLSVCAQFGMDSGELLGKNVGGQVSISYSGIFGK